MTAATTPRTRHASPGAPVEGRVSAESARARLVLGVVSSAALGAGLLGLALDLDLLRGSALFVFCAVGIGSAPWQLLPGLRLDTRLTLTGVTSLAVWTLPATAMVLTGWWRPHLVFAAVALVAVVLHAVGLAGAWQDRRSARPRPVPHPRSTGRAAWLPVLLGVVGVLLCLRATLATGTVDPGTWGFLVEVGPGWYAGLALVLVAVVWSLGGDERRTAVLVLLLVAVLTLTPSLLYEGPRSQSAFKHVDLVLQIREDGVLHTSVSVYEAWPGFFAATAWLCDVTGIRDVGQLAEFWPPFLALFRVAALRALAGRLLTSTAQRWTAVLLAVLADAISADYFSPQSVGFVLGVAVYALALSPGSGRVRPAALLLAGCTVAVSHQLSPFVIAGVLVVLAVFGVVRPWWIPLLVAVPAGVWAAVHLPSVLGFLDLGSLGQLTNFRPPPLETAPGLARLPVVPATVAALVVGIGTVAVLAVVAFLRSWRNGRSWALLGAAGVGLVMVVVNPYGQEGIFRAALFAVPWLAVLAAGLSSPRPTPRTRVPVLVLTAVLTGTFLVSSFGLDGVNVVRRADVAAVTTALDRGGEDLQLLYLGAGDLPDTLRDGVLVLDREVLGVPVEHAPGASADTLADELTAAYADYWSPVEGGPAPLYALWSPVSGDYAEAYGLQSLEEFEQLRDALLRSPYWTVVHEQDGTVLLELDAVRHAAERAAAGA